ncbi:PhoH family protein [Berryella wangjianweii]|uniref:PhoH-like protein n=1 Tax=Berryella wangjianweii TaxID=2734634 RepID=A0A6M8J0D8_9ACTN|nr:PhoH family protein [Berryella wangjianweii]QKF06994.1 PhoH family protein [Berryella wangjianweii]
MTQNALPSSQTIRLAPGTDPALVCGPGDRNLRRLEALLGVCASMRDETVALEGDAADVSAAALVVAELQALSRQGAAPGPSLVERAVHAARAGGHLPSQLRDDVLYAGRQGAVRPKTSGQKRYADAIRNNVITFGLGPAGTGKTFLAMALAAAALERREVGRIVLTRPVVEAGESLGFLPGTLAEKVDPYIRPLYDALFSLIGAERARELIDTGVVEIVPLAFMRGRTLSDSFIVLDEAQNATPAQMKMFLTRLGFGSRMVVTGDASQFDIASGPSGLLRARRVLEGMPDVAFAELSGADVVRHSLVSRIVAAYARFEEEGA